MRGSSPAVFPWSGLSHGPQWAVADAHHLRRRGIAFLQCPLDKLIKYTLTDTRAACIYERVGGDQLRQQPFWSKYTEMVKRRNKVVHRGESVTVDEARSYLETPWSLVIHLRRVAGVDDRPAAPTP
jgi:hypothetical protein